MIGVEEAKHRERRIFWIVHAVQNPQLVNGAGLNEQGQSTDDVAGFGTLIHVAPFRATAAYFAASCSIV